MVLPKKLIFLLFIVLLSGCSDLKQDKENSSQELKEYKDVPKVFLCPQDDCEGELFKVINSAKESVHCAFYDLDLERIINILDKKSKNIEVKLVVDDANFDNVKHLKFAIKDSSSGLMHNKFCIIDNKIILTGSFNPTENGAYKNDNNLVIIESFYLSKNYEDEFNELWNSEFRKGDNVIYPEFYLNNKKIENYFCPEDNCAYYVAEEIKKAKNNIYFMTFSFTNNRIATAIILKHYQGLDIKGVFEARQVSKYSKFNLLEYQGIDVKRDNNKANMHHKVFIIDNKTVITGSFNPTEGADTRNDENIIIMHDKTMANLFMQEFERVYNQELSVAE